MQVARKLVAEFLGTLLLAAAVLGAGIMAQHLARDPALALLCDALATGGALVAFLLMFGPISGAHLNPVVTVVMAWTGDLTPRLAAGYVVVQLAGAILGALLANAMFGIDAAMATTVRTGAPVLLAEGVATFGLIGVVICVGRTRPESAPYAVAAYIVGAYWFTSSTSFANPAITLGRAFTDTYGGIRLVDVPGFIAAEAAGGALGALAFCWLVPLGRPGAHLSSSNSSSTSTSMTSPSSAEAGRASSDATSRR